MAENLTLNRIRRVIVPLTDYSSDPYPSKGILRSATNLPRSTWLGLGIFRHLYDEAQLNLAIHHHKRIVVDNVRSDETARPQLEVDLVKATKQFDDYTFVAALAGDLGRGYTLEPQGIEDSPRLRDLKIALGHIGIVLTPTVTLLAAEAIAEACGIGPGIGAKTAALSIGTAVVGGGLAYKGIMGVKSLMEHIPLVRDLIAEGDLLRRPVEADPLHLRMAMGVALEKGWNDIAEIRRRSKGKESGSVAVFGKYMRNLAEGTYIVLNRDMSPHRYINDDDRLHAGKRERNDFATIERSLLFAEIASDPGLGLMLLAKYKPNDSLFLHTISRLSPAINRVLHDIMEKSLLQNADPVVAADENNIRVIEALDAMEVPQMMQLMVNLALSYGKDGERLLFHGRFGFSNGYRTANSEELRQTAFNNISQKMVTPLISAILTARNEMPSGQFFRKLKHDFVRAIPPIGKDDSYMGGNSVPDWIDRADDPQNAYQAEAEVASWNAMRTFLPLIKNKVIPENEVVKLFRDLRDAWNKRPAYKSGIPLHHSLIKFFEGLMDSSPEATNFLYAEFTNLVDKNFISQLDKKPEEIIKSVDTIIRSLNKRGSKRSSDVNISALEMKNIDALGYGIVYAGNQLIETGSSYARSIPAGNQSALEAPTVLWLTRIIGLKRLALSLINNRRDAQAEIPGYSAMQQLVSRIDEIVSTEMGELVDHLYVARGVNMSQAQ